MYVYIHIFTSNNYLSHKNFLKEMYIHAIATGLHNEDTFHNLKTKIPKDYTNTASFEN